MRYSEKMKPPMEQFRMDLHRHHSENLNFGMGSEGHVIFDLRWPDGTLIEHWERTNLIVSDCGILVASLLRNPGSRNGINMLAVGTGAVGVDLLNPDAPKLGQRRLNTEIFRKAVTTQFRNESGYAVAYPTHIVDFTTTFGEAEANGPLNEMGLMSAYSSNPLILNPILNGPDDYDPTIDVSQLDLLGNYLPFPVSSKFVGSVLAVTWRFTI